MDTKPLATNNATGETPSKANDEPPMKLIAYNLLSGCLWSFAFLNVVATTAVFQNMEDVFRLTNKWTTAIQCLAVVEIYNSATGIVRSPLFTTTIQVLSRLLIVILVWTVLPEAKGNASYAYLSLHLAWCVAEVTRYYYYASNLMSKVPGTGVHMSPLLEWLRYNAFLVLYPVGIASECYMVYHAVGAALARPGALAAALAAVLAAALLAYVPGTVVLYSHMLRQRARFNTAAADRKKQKKTT